MTNYPYRCIKCGGEAHAPSVDKVDYCWVHYHKMKSELKGIGELQKRHHLFLMKMWLEWENDKEKSETRRK